MIMISMIRTRAAYNTAAADRPRSRDVSISESIATAFFSIALPCRDHDLMRVHSHEHVAHELERALALAREVARYIYISDREFERDIAIAT